MHDRFKRKVWAFKKDFTSALAQALVRQSPYDVPEQLEECIIEFGTRIEETIEFDDNGMAEIDLSKLVSVIDPILWGIPVIAKLNEAKDPTTPDIIFRSRYEGRPSNPDRDFIDITAVAQNIAVYFAQIEDAKAYLSKRPK